MLEPFLFGFFRKNTGKYMPEDEVGNGKICKDMNLERESICKDMNVEANLF